MKEYTISFEGRSNGININQLNNTTLLPLFKNYSGQIIDMYRMVATLNNNNYQVVEIVNNSNNTVYNMLSKETNTKLTITITKDIDYKKKNEKMYIPTINILKGMSNNAKIINNNVFNFNSFQDSSIEPAVSNGDYKPNLKLIKGTTYKPSIKKMLKTKKGKIVLCTIIGFSIVAGTFIAHTFVARAETQKYLDESTQYSYQVDKSSDNKNHNLQLYQALQNGEVDDSLTKNEFEEMKMEYNEQNYQNVR